MRIFLTHVTDSMLGRKSPLNSLNHVLQYRKHPYEKEAESPICQTIRKTEE